jgi:hypothetical protein
LPVEFWLAERTEPQREAAEAVLAIARRYRDLVIEAVTIGVLIKRARTIVELRPKTKWLALSFLGPPGLDDARITRTIELGDTTYYVVRLRDATDVDDTVRGWLALALRASNAARARSPQQSDRSRISSLAPPPRARAPARRGRAATPRGAGRAGRVRR